MRAHFIHFITPTAAGKSTNSSSSAKCDVRRSTTGRNKQEAQRHRVVSTIRSYPATVGRPCLLLDERVVAWNRYGF